MKNIVLSILTLVLLFSLIPSASAIAEGTTPGEEPDSGAVVCPPDVYLSSPGDCLPLGPSPYITEMSQLGLTFPPRALPAFKPDPALTQLPFFYFKLEEDTVPVLSGPDGNDIGQPFLPGFIDVS